MATAFFAKGNTLSSPKGADIQLDHAEVVLLPETAQCRD